MNMQTSAGRFLNRQNRNKIPFICPPRLMSANCKQTGERDFVRKAAMTDITKLPKWAQDHIRNLERERDTAIRGLNEYIDNQTKSPFYFSDYLCTGENAGPTSKVVYIQTNQMTVEHAGVQLDLLLRDGYIDMNWSGEHRVEVAFIPQMHQSARLVSKENMR